MKGFLSAAFTLLALPALGAELRIHNDAGAHEVECNGRRYHLGGRHASIPFDHHDVDHHGNFTCRAFDVRGVPLDSLSIHDPQDNRAYPWTIRHRH